MCEASMLVALGASALSSGIGAAGQLSASRSQEKASLWQAMEGTRAAYGEARDIGRATIDQAMRGTRAYTLAASIAQKNAELALARGRLDENRVRDETDRATASQRAFFAGGNIDPASGSALMLAAFGAAQGETDAQITRANAFQEAAGAQWSAYGALDHAEDGLQAASRTIDSSFKAADSRSRGLTGGAAMTADANRKAGMFGAASTLLSSASQWATLGAQRGWFSTGKTPSTFAGSIDIFKGIY
ncbi:hypothetical protein [Chelatococcus asaccharovorans]|uniref:Uncharacterized protein n=1 Tax=Chelatococcus asaccharovorans TaxID=28210 RepID=A0A2V3UAH1_9HYPH|nr:hypothetical protein [Chelatococcus asaccharovorans]MBS7703174.1 hypothetical protein [Chelatococcus asaccharovorans]PXW61503.1 hypothetical protein C7450_10318 [Chelatococcus asaccharovorans]